jgi:hypothetical protein
VFRFAPVLAYKSLLSEPGFDRKNLGRGTLLEKTPLMIRLIVSLIAAVVAASVKVPLPGAFSPEWGDPEQFLAFQRRCAALLPQSAGC